jgi:hypothetical protein
VRNKITIFVPRVERLLQYCLGIRNGLVPLSRRGKEKRQHEGKIKTSIFYGHLYDSLRKIYPGYSALIGSLNRIEILPN